MNNKPLYDLLRDNAGVRALLAVSPTGRIRVYPWGEAPQDTTKPYAVYSLISGVPENYLGQVPDTDNKVFQVNVYAKAGDAATDVAEAIRDALEPYSHMTRFDMLLKEPDTDLYPVSMDFSFWQNRNAS